MTVDRADHTLSVAGCITGANACYEAELVDVRPVWDRLRVVVRSSDASGPEELCAQVITHLGYRVDLSFGAGPLPAAAAVVHRRRGDDRTVTTLDLE